MSNLARYCRKIFVGDVHGCFDELMLLLNRLKHDPKRDELYFVGDLAVKGPKSNDVIEFIRTTQKTYSVMGNHDYELLRVARACNILHSDIKIPSFQFSTYYSKDPLSMIQHIECAKTLSKSNVEYMASLPLSLSPHPKLRVVHAGLIPHIELSKQNAWTLMNIRNIIEKPTPKHIDLTINNRPVPPRQSLEGSGYHDLGVPWINVYSGPEHVFFGHDAKRSLQLGKYATGLDTGVCYGGTLTAAIVKCDENHDDLINEIHENQYQFEEWEMDNINTYVSASGVVYRLIQQKANEVYRNPFKDINNQTHIVS
eukprot:279509_1